MPLNRKTRKQTRKNRLSPTESATLYSEGTILKGNNTRYWVVKKTKSGIHRWVPQESVEINGFRKLTVDYLETMIDKEVKIYTREYSDMWPSKDIMKESPILRFIPNGDARIDNNKKVFTNWLHTRTPSIKPGQYFYVVGKGFYDYGRGETYQNMELQVDSKNGQIVSPNLMNTEAFVKI